MGFGVIQLWFEVEEHINYSEQGTGRVIAEWMSTPDEEVTETALPGKESPQEWIMYFDGAFSLQGAGGGMLIVAPLWGALEVRRPNALCPGRSHQQYI